MPLLRSLALFAVVAALPSCCGTNAPERRATRAEEPPVGRVPSGVLDRYLAATTSAERAAIVEGITKSTPESRRVLVLAFDEHDIDVFPAAVDTICRRFAGYVPPGGSETQIRCAQEWLATHAR